MRSSESDSDVSSGEAVTESGDTDDLGGLLDSLEGISLHQPREDGVPVHSGDELPPFRFSWRRLWRFLGPGFLMSLAYLDPGNLESNLQAGAYTGLRLTWVLWWATMMGLVMQESAARLALVTGCDLAQLVRARYPRWLNYVVYFNMEAAVIAADFQWCGPRHP